MKNSNNLTTLTAIFTVIALLGIANVAFAYDARNNNKNGVRVDVTPITLSLDQAAAFSIRLNTHSVALVQDLAAVSELRDNNGRSYKPLRWEGSEPGGHHRSGKLFFPEIKGPAESFILIIRDIGGVERSFEWELE